MVNNLSFSEHNSEPSNRISFELAKGALYTYASLVLLKVLLLVNSIIVARWLGPNNLGIYSILLQIQNLVITFGLFGIPISVSKFIAEYTKKDKSDLQNIVSSLITFSFIISVIIAIPFFISSDFLASKIYKEPALKLLIRISSFTIFISLLNSLYKAIMQGFQKIESLAKINVAVGLVSVVITFLMVTNMNLFGVVIRDLVIAIISIISLSVLLYKTISFASLKVSLKFDKDIILKVFVFAIPLFMGSIFVYAGDLFIRSNLAIKCGFDKSGLFYIADNFFQIIYFIPQAIAIPFLPIITRMYFSDVKNFSKNASRVVKLTGFLVLPVAVVLGIFSKALIGFLYGGNYLGSWTVSFLVIFGSVFLSPSYIIGQAFVGAGKSWQTLSLRFIQVSVNVAISYYFISLWGLIGLGAAILISNVFSSLLFAIYGINILKLKDMSLGIFQLLVLIFGCISYFIISKTTGVFFISGSLITVLMLLLIEYLLLNKEDKVQLIEITHTLFRNPTKVKINQV